MQPERETSRHRSAYPPFSLLSSPLLSCSLLFSHTPVQMDVRVGPVSFHGPQLQAAAEVPRVQPAEGQPHAVPRESERFPGLGLGRANQSRLLLLQSHACSSAATGRHFRTRAPAAGRRQYSSQVLSRCAPITRVPKTATNVLTLVTEDTPWPDFSRLAFPTAERAGEPTIVALLPSRRELCRLIQTCSSVAEYSSSENRSRGCVISRHVCCSRLWVIPHGHVRTDPHAKTICSRVAAPFARQHNTPPAHSPDM